MPNKFSFATWKHLPRVAALAVVALASTALTEARAAEFASAIDLSSLNGTTGFRLHGAERAVLFERSVASAGDVNGDGFADVLIGDPYGDTNSTPSGIGLSYVVFGKRAGFASAINLTSLNGTTGFRLDGIEQFDHSGNSVASAGDVNGDGFADVVIGARLAGRNGASKAGESYVVFGKATSFASSINLGSLNGSTGFRLNGIDAYDFSGVSVASAGDVNGDGFADLFIGAPGGDPNGASKAGESYVVFGKSTGFAPVIGLGILLGANGGFGVLGIDINDYSGRSVAAAGDVNGDGFGDLVIGAERANPGGDSYAGESYVVFGKASGLAPVVQLSTLNGTTGFRLDGIDAGDFSGYSVASAGDVNGDGFADLVIGARRANPGGDALAGESYVVFGKASGFASAIQLADLNGTTGFRLDGINTGDESGTSVASAGDVNGDGFSDLIVGAPKANANFRVNSGKTFVVFGKGPAAGSFASAIDLASLNGITGFRLDGKDEDDFSGRSVASAGDVNGDGFADLVIGTSDVVPDSDPETYVVFGRAPDAQVARFGSAASQYISGGAFADLLGGFGGNDRLEGRGGGDTLTGGTGTDTAVYAHSPGAVSANLANPSLNVGDALGDTYFSIETLEGTRFSDTLTGDGLSNSISGGEGNDTLQGAGSADRLVGGPGRDIMSGGTGLGIDVFLFNKLSESVVGILRDQITDFDAGSPTTAIDRIDLRPIDAQTGVTGNQAFTFIGNSDFTGVKGQLRIALSGTTTIVSGDVNGDSVRDFEIALLNFTNLANLTSIDFLK